MFCHQVFVEESCFSKQFIYKHFFVVRKFFSGSYAKALEAFVHDPFNKWCPTWVRRSYDVQNSDEANDQDAIAVTKKFVFQDSEPENENTPKDEIETLQSDVEIQEF